MRRDRPALLRRGPLGALLVLALTTASGVAQVQTCSSLMLCLTSVVPAGAKAGATLELTWTGTDLEDPTALVFSHPGIKATAIVPPDPQPDPKDPKKPLPPKQPITKYTIAVAPDVPLGAHDVRLVNKWGVSNPRAFVIGDLKEEQDKEPNNYVDAPQKIVEINTVVNGAINGGIDVDYFAFTGKKGQRLLVQVAAASLDSRLIPEIKVLTKDGRELG